MLVSKVCSHCSLCTVSGFHSDIKSEDVLRKVVDVVDHHLVGVVVDENVNATHLLDCLVNDLLAVRPLFKVDCQSVALLSLLFNHLLGVLCVLLLLGEVGDEAVCALHSE
jgi:hypothetical protein